MSDDNFTEVSSEGWLSRIGKSITGMLVGGAMAVIAFPLLWWNEGRSVHTYQGLTEGEKIAVDVSADRVEPSNDGKLVHVTGRAEGKDTVSDSIFAVSAPGLIRLKREVELFQWIEKKESHKRKKFGGGEETTTEYTYKTDWDSKVHNSAEFRKPEGHSNPPPAYKPQSFSSHDASLVAFRLPDFLINSWSDYKPHPLPAADQLPESLRGKATLRDDWLYVSANADAPQVGDARVKFESIPAGDASVLARQVKDTFEAYATKAGTSIARIASGVHSKESMFASAKSENKMMTWLLRAAGFFLMFLGLTFVLSPLKVLADVIPFMGSVVGVGTGLIAFLLSVIGSSLTVALAWVWYRPLLGVALLIVTAGGIYFLAGAFKKKAAA
jgi:hypothetical protein